MVEVARRDGHREHGGARAADLIELDTFVLDDVQGLINKLFIQELPENLNEWVQAWSEFKSA